MTDTTAITPEERARIRAIASNTSMLSYRDGIHDALNSLLTALEAAEAESVRLRADYACEHQSLVFHEQMVARLMDRVETLEWLREVEALYGDTGWIFNQKQCAIDELHVTVLAAREALEES